MAEISDVYGQSYQSDANQARLDHLINIMANNIAHRQLSFKLSDTFSLWGGSQDLSPVTLETLINKIQAMNSKLKIFHLKKGSSQINMLPELIVDTPVEYFMIIDAEMNRAYFIYITPMEVNAY